MAEEIELRVVSRADSRGFNQAAKDIKSLKGESDRLGDSFDATGGDAADLSIALEESRKKAAALRAELSRSTGGIPVVPGGRGGRGGIGGGAAIGSAAGTAAGTGFVEGLMEAIGGIQGLGARLRGAAILGGTTLGLAMAPVLGGIISAAVVGTVGLGGVIGGAVLAARNPQVVAAWKTLGNQIMSELRPAGEAFVQPMIDAASTLGQGFRDAKIAETLTAAAPLMDDIASGAAGFVREMGPGLHDAITKGAPPVFRVLDRELADLGGAFGDMFTSMSRAGDEAALAFKDALDLTEDTVVALGDVMAGLSRIYALTRNPLLDRVFDVVPMFGLIEVIGKLGDVSERTKTRNELAMDAAVNYGTAAGAHSDEIRNYAGAVKDVGDSAAQAQREVSILNGKIEDFLDQSMDAAQASDDYEAAIDDVTASLKENGRTIDANTEKGRANRQAFRDAVKAAQDHRAAMIESGVSTAEANTIYDANITRLKRIATNAGISEKELREMAGEYRINVITSFFTRGKPPKITAGGAVVVGGGHITEFQHGGTSPAHEPFRVHADEVLFSDRQHYVATKAQADSMASKASSGGGMLAHPITLSGSALMDRLITDLDAELRRRGLRLAAVSN
jgi:hypothetical protein